MFFIWHFNCRILASLDILSAYFLEVFDWVEYTIVKKGIIEESYLSSRMYCNWVSASRTCLIVIVLLN